MLFYALQHLVKGLDNYAVRKDRFCKNVLHKLNSNETCATMIKKLPASSFNWSGAPELLQSLCHSHTARCSMAYSAGHVSESH